MLLRNLSEVYKKGLRFMSDLYNRIEILCKEKKISITTMCKESGASRASLSDLKVGRKQSLSADTLSNETLTLFGKLNVLKYIKHREFIIFAPKPTIGRCL